ncbi:MAG: NAD(P)/FAD-dependent oxidoreductase [Actinomycetota bacterium]|nr:NAD(P)/FAD-dependent oxidoreductase [Actinomycetota bacterium]
MWTETLIVGGGFGGALCAHELDRILRDRSERTLLVAPENFLLFSPLLPEAASGTLEPRHAVIPLREIVGETRLLAGEVTSIDVDARTAEVRDINGNTQTVEYRTAVLSPGSVPNTVPIPGLLDNAVGFKSIADAIWLRNRLLHQLDAANAATDVEERRRLLTFTFIGGGYAGVEALAELESLARDAAAQYPAVAPGDFRWVLVEAVDTLLPGLDPKLARYTEKQLRKRGIEVHLGTRMTSCEDRQVVLSDEGVAPYHSDTIVWTAGQRPSPLIDALGLPTNERGRLVTDDHCRVDGRDDLFALGDAAAVPDPDGGICPLTAQHALRQARTVANNVAATFGVGEAKPFTYRNRGLAVTLGNLEGVAQVKGFTFRGFPAWWMGRSYHLIMMPGLGRKLRVLTDWTLALLFPRDTAQLGQLGRPSPLAPAERA